MKPEVFTAHVLRLLREKMNIKIVWTTFVKNIILRHNKCDIISLSQRKR